MNKSLLIFLTLGFFQSVHSIERKINFNRDVRPILSSKCFQCHGPDENSRKAKLRLDLRESAHSDRAGVRAVTPGDIAKSEIWHRIVSSDKEEIMPPPEIKKPRRNTGLSLSSNCLHLRPFKMQSGYATRSTVSYSKTWSNSVWNLPRRQAVEPSFGVSTLT